MKFLLDTHTFLWALIRPQKLSPRATEIIEDGANEVYLGVVSFWEIALKFALGKLDLDGVTPSEMPKAAEDLGLLILPVESADGATYHNLIKTSHKDPFDRMIVWQAIRRQWSLVSSDAALDLYKPQGLLLVR